MQINLIDLVNQAKNGNREACSKLYQITFKSSYYFALRVINNERDASKAVEETYKKAFSSIASLKNPESFEVWIKHITAVKSIEFLKQKNQHMFDGQAVLPSEIIEDKSEFLPKGLEKSVNAGKAINKIVASLSDCQRVVTMLYYYNEMPVGHIAKVLGCSEDKVIAELCLSRSYIKKHIDRMINRETAVYPFEGKPLLVLILQSAEKQQIVEETLLRTIFSSATEGLFLTFEPKKLSESVPVSIATSVSEEFVSEKRNGNVDQVKRAERKKYSNISTKLGAMTKKQKTTMIVCAVLVLAVVFGAIGLPEIISSFSNSDDISAQQVDDSILKNLEPYEKNYENMLTTAAQAIKEENDYSGGNFNFIYFNDNDIPDLTVSYKQPFDNSPDLYDELLICVDGNNKEVFEYIVMNIWVGQKGYYIVSDTDYDNGEKSDAFYKYKYENEDDPEIFSGGLRYDKFLNDEQAYQESWIYMADADSDMLELSGWEEYNQKKELLFDGFYRVTSGYSIEEFVNSGKSLIKFLKKAKPERYVSFEENSKTTTLPVTSTQNVQTETTTTSTFYHDASSGDWEKLEDDLNTILTFCGEYNSSSDNAYEVVLPVNCTEMIYSHYFDTEPEYAYGNDPLGYFEESEYYIFDGENVDWIIANVFNQTPDHNLKTKDRYFYNGNYYAVFYPSSCPITEVSVVGKEKQADGSYNLDLKEISYIGEGYGSEDEVSYTYSGTAKATLKNIDGKKVWSFFTIKMDEPEGVADEETSDETASEWEMNYLKELQSGDFDGFEFILTAIDDNDIPDMILIMHRSRGALTYYFMNGNTEHEDGADDSIDEVYFDEYGNMKGRYYYEDATCISESYNFYTAHHGEVVLESMVGRIIAYKDSSKTQLIQEDYSYKSPSDNYEEVISKELYEEEVKRVQNYYTLANATEVEDFLQSNNKLSDYYINYRTA
ncbi:MAG: hypothetical protein IKV76_00195 [Clostridia bacterium]|nr:hypothetical protein [Clostridia bacterium]